MKRLFASAVTVAIVWVACGGSADSRALASAQNAWQAASVDSYSFVYSRTCECDDVTSGLKRVDVVDGEVVSVTYLADGKEQAVDVGEYGYTIEALFELIDANAGRGIENNIDYADLGYPTLMMLDLEGMAVDGGFGLTVHDFTVDPA